jgi:hypothetical protein
MATYTPVVLRTPTNITASDVAVFTSSGVNIMRTFSFVTETAHSVFLGIGAAGAADATTNRILDSYLLTINIPYIVNGWWVLANTDKLNTHADSIATNAPVFGAWGYSYA